jgi:hypothetical protein
MMQITEEDRKSYRVVKLPDNRDSVFDDRGFEEIDSRSRRGATFPASVPVISALATQN